MTWLTPAPGEHPAKRFREMLDSGETIVAPGVFNGLTALLAKRAGAKALYLSGAAFSSSMGMPDVGLFTLDELQRNARQIVRVTRIPLIVDADTGFGGALNVMRTVRELEGARCAAIQIEDQVDPKRCGHLDGKEVTSADTFAE
jgi:methylisocitrate lyase